MGMLHTMVYHLDPALVLTPSPRALMLQLRDMLPMVTLVTTMERETLKQILLFWLLDMATLLSPMLCCHPCWIHPLIPCRPLRQLSWCLCSLLNIYKIPFLTVEIKISLPPF